MTKLDYKKEYPALYKVPAGKIVMVAVPKLNYLMVDGYGDPNNSQLFQDAVSALYTLSYTIKFMIKKGEQQIDYGVMPLEGLWWTDNMKDFSMEDKASWKWTLMIMQPDFVTEQVIEEAKLRAAKKKDLPLLSQVRFESMEEGECVQTLYTGPYREETATIIKLHNYIKDMGYNMRGKHREIYLSDMRRTAPEKLKTIIRQPIIKN
ncbi:MAG: GyrI-like domain-containing protein [Flavipsychrobacter sp.]|nr:GyrI-like domain-containing protein [Flavipsychrobacter sp.]